MAIDVQPSVTVTNVGGNSGRRASEREVYQTMLATQERMLDALRGDRGEEYLAQERFYNQLYDANPAIVKRLSDIAKLEADRNPNRAAAATRALPTYFDFAAKREGLDPRKYRDTRSSSSWQAQYGLSDADADDIAAVTRGAYERGTPEYARAAAKRAALNEITTRLAKSGMQDPVLGLTQAGDMLAARVKAAESGITPEFSDRLSLDKQTAAAYQISGVALDSGVEPDVAFKVYRDLFGSLGAAYQADAEKNPKPDQKAVPWDTLHDVATKAVTRLVSKGASTDVLPAFAELVNKLAVSGIEPSMKGGLDIVNATNRLIGAVEAWDETKFLELTKGLPEVKRTAARESLLLLSAADRGALSSDGELAKEAEETLGSLFPEARPLIDALSKETTSVGEGLDAAVLPLNSDPAYLAIKGVNKKLAADYIGSKNAMQQANAKLYSAASAFDPKFDSYTPEQKDVVAGMAKELLDSVQQAVEKNDGSAAAKALEIVGQMGGARGAKDDAGNPTYTPAVAEAVKQLNEIVKSAGAKSGVVERDPSAVLDELVNAPDTDPNEAYAVVGELRRQLGRSSDETDVLKVGGVSVDVRDIPREFRGVSQVRDALRTADEAVATTLAGGVNVVTLGLLNKGRIQRLREKSAEEAMSGDDPADRGIRYLLSTGAIRRDETGKVFVDKTVLKQAKQRYIDTRKSKGLAPINWGAEGATAPLNTPEGRAYLFAVVGGRSPDPTTTAAALKLQEAVREFSDARRNTATIRLEAGVTDEALQSSPDAQRLAKAVDQVVSIYGLRGNGARLGGKSEAEMKRIQLAIDRFAEDKEKRKSDDAYRDKTLAAKRDESAARRFDSARKAWFADRGKFADREIKAAIERGKATGVVEVPTTEELFARYEALYPMPSE